MSAQDWLTEAGERLEALAAADPQSGEFLVRLNGFLRAACQVPQEILASSAQRHGLRVQSPQVAHLRGAAEMLGMKEAVAFLDGFETAYARLAADRESGFLLQVGSGALGRDALRWGRLRLQPDVAVPAGARLEVDITDTSAHGRGRAAAYVVTGKGRQSVGEARLEWAPYFAQNPDLDAVEACRAFLARLRELAAQTDAPPAA